jgi:23S rRNA pseudouridine2605 synthase
MIDGDTIRLSKYLSQNGIASRRKADEIISSGRVKVNSQIVTEPFHRVVPGKDKVTVDGIWLTKTPKKIYVALYKPVGYLSDLADTVDRKLARDLISLEGFLFPIGRLDYQSEGLMIFTNDGALAQQLMHPKYEVEKEYLVKLNGTLTKQDTDLMRSGISIDGDRYRVKKVSFVRTTQKNSWYSITISEGKNRMIRKIAEALSHSVLRLKRVRINNISLGNLKPGEYRLIAPSEMKAILPL